MIRRTMLSGKPAPESALVTALSVLVLSAAATACWKAGGACLADFAANPGRVFAHGEIWRLFTALAVHADLRHLVSNTILFTVFAYLLYGYFGFTVFPLAAVALGGAVNALSLLTYGPAVRLLGASGMVYLMAGIWLGLYLLIERRWRFRRRLMRATGFALVVLMPSVFQNEVSYRTHAIGFGLGLVFAMVVFRVRRVSIRSREVWEAVGGPDPDPESSLASDSPPGGDDL